MDGRKNMVDAIVPLPASGTTPSVVMMGTSNPLKEFSDDGKSREEEKEDGSASEEEPISRRKSEGSVDPSGEIDIMVEKKRITERRKSGSSRAAQRLTPASLKPPTLNTHTSRPFDGNPSVGAARSAERGSMVYALPDDFTDHILMAKSRVRAAAGGGAKNRVIPLGRRSISLQAESVQESLEQSTSTYVSVPTVLLGGDKAIPDQAQDPLSKTQEEEEDFTPGAFRVRGLKHLDSNRSMFQKDNSKPSLLKDASTTMNIKSGKAASSRVFEIAAQLVDEDVERQRETELRELRKIVAKQRTGNPDDAGLLPSVSPFAFDTVEAVEVELDEKAASRFKKKLIASFSCALIAVVGSAIAVYFLFLDDWREPLVSTFMPTAAVSSSPSLSPTSTLVPAACFRRAEDLHEAVDVYLQGNFSNSEVLVERGPISMWCVSEIEDFGSLFSTERNILAESFNDDISMWDTSNARNMSDMFRGAVAFDQPLSAWDVSNVVEMNGVFRGASSFDQDLSQWDVSRVTIMAHMFELSPFNQPLQAWNVSKVTDMAQMFNLAKSFNQNLSRWDVSKVTTMRDMFWDAETFNGDVTTWDVSKVTDMISLLDGCFSFDQDLSKWNTSSVVNMDFLFFETSFNHDISSWDVSRVTSMEGTFYGATLFNQPLDAWDVSSVTNMDSTFQLASSFNQNLTNWDVSAVTNMVEMFWKANSFNGDVSTWNVSLVTTMESLFDECFEFNQDISNWDVSRVTNFAYMFDDCRFFEQDLSRWDVSSAESLSRMFRDTNFNHDISGWQVSKVIDMKAMFQRNPAFNQDLSRWEVSSVGDMMLMFSEAIMFNADIGSWAVDAVKDMDSMFMGASSFNQDISRWNMDNVAYTNSMFENAMAFDQDLSPWDTAMVETMASMFEGTIYNRPLSSWNVAHVNDMSSMFAGNTAFNQPLTTWDVANVTSTASMFAGATAFDQDLSSWDTSRVEDFTNMFQGAARFSSNLCAWGSRTQWATLSREDGLNQGIFNGTACATTQDPDPGAMPPGPFCNVCQ